MSTKRSRKAAVAGYSGMPGISAIDAEVDNPLARRIKAIDSGAYSHGDNDGGLFSHISSEVVNVVKTNIQAIDRGGYDIRKYGVNLGGLSASTVPGTFVLYISSDYYNVCLVDKSSSVNIPIQDSELLHMFLLTARLVVKLLSADNSPILPLSSINNCQQILIDYVHQCIANDMVVRVEDM